MREIDRERVRASIERGEGQREKQTPHRAGSPMWDPIPGLQDHDLSQRQLLNQLSHPGTPIKQFQVQLNETLHMLVIKH